MEHKQNKIRMIMYNVKGTKKELKIVKAFHSGINIRK